MAVLMPLDIKPHTVPHLKALTGSIPHRSGHGHGSTFKQRYTFMKNTILLHKWPKRRFHVTVAVCLWWGLDLSKEELSVSVYQETTK